MKKGTFMALVCLGLMALTTVGQTSGKKGTWKLKNFILNRLDT